MQQLWLVANIAFQTLWQITFILQQWCSTLVRRNWTQVMWTDPARSSPTASASRVSSSLATRSPAAARQSSTELSGSAGLNTGDERRSKPVVEKAANTREEKRVWSWHKEPLGVRVSGTCTCTSTYRKRFHLPVASTPPRFLLWSAGFFLDQFRHLLKKIRKTEKH